MPFLLPNQQHQSTEVFLKVEERRGRDRKRCAEMKAEGRCPEL